ncbi:golgin subfamily B member 1-like isoform X2 [Penaeus japonicus]|nr:golgin subfamily B member 1-like isoform X2 [Penaeus japonicus]XP_042880602.1 golgin subfamily B member 1-like isoform X2 [Penaeus japonicus]XP_042880603.1 golgin subfamily B member 1-like isoform X2 [Penaeus japonicus]
METGSLRADKDTGTCYSDGLGNLSTKADSQVFDLVIDPLTDFKGEESVSYSSSPQESYNLSLPEKRQESLDTRLRSTPDSESTEFCSSLSQNEDKQKGIPLLSSPLPSSQNLLDGLIDSHLWTSDVSLANGSFVDGASGTSKGVGGSSNPRRLVVAEVHRFGCHPPCAGSPHDLASCPVAAASVTHDACQLQDYNAKLRQNNKNEADPLKVLSEASSALALTETLIGPLRIPPVSQEVLDQVLCTMEKKTVKQVSTANGGSSLINTVTEKTSDLHSLPGAINTNDIHTGKLLGSLQSVLQPRVHQLSTTKLQTFISAGNGQPDDVQLERIATTDVQTGVTEPLRYDSVISLPEEQRRTEQLTRKNSRVITVPVGMSDHGPVEVYREVHQYPAGVITTTVEKKSYLGQSESEHRPPSGPAKRKCRSRKLKQKRADHHASQSSIASGSSAGTSVASGSTLISRSSSELTPISRSQAASSKASLNDARSDAAGPIAKPVLSAAIMQMRQALEHVSNASDNHSDKSSGGAELSSNFSDTSSNLSTLSDLSGYEDEYIRIKRLVSDAVIPPDDYKKLVNKANSKSSTSKPMPVVDYEKIIRDLQAQKEDLEIQLHRLSIQVQNAVREKELYQQQLELMQTKITETNQKQYFEVLKQRANLEGQLEMLKQELENTVYEKNQLQSKISEALKESETNKDAATAAKESESKISARLQKYEETNKNLEEKLRNAEEKIQRISKDYESSQSLIQEHIAKNEQLEMRVSQFIDAETHMKAELDGLRSRLSHVQEDCEAKTKAQIQAETAANKSTMELQKSNASSLWYQEQLQIAQAARAKLQQDLLDTKSSLAKITSEKDTLEITVQTMKREAEDGQARTVREKASLVAHLEALQADMAEREALVSQLERDRGSDTKLMEDRRQRLEQDRQRIHKLRLDLADTERQLDFVKDDLKHKCSLLTRYENELKDLRTSEAVNQEVLGERDIRISNLEQTVDELKSSLSKHQEEGKIKDTSINILKEEKLKLEVRLAAANNEKKEVDDAIIKVREDMTKLSSNFYRMKHDLAAKDRQIEVHKKETEEILKARTILEKKYEALEKKTTEDEEKKKLMKEMSELKLEIKELSSTKEKAESEQVGLKQILKSLEIEKKGLGEAVRLREEQIQNMQGSVENYREAILKKDEELYVAHEQNSSLEKTYMELRRQWENLKEETLALRQDSEAYIEHEKLQKREKAELKESIQKERKLKQNMERKIESLVKLHEEEKAKILLEKENNEKSLAELTKALQTEKDERRKIYEKKEVIEQTQSNLLKEIQSLKEENSQLQSKLNEKIKELDKLSRSQKEKEDIISSIKTQLDNISKTHHDTKKNLAQLQEEKDRSVGELTSKLQVKVGELDTLKKSQSDAQSLISRINQEKNRLNEQVTQLLAENTHLKKTPIVNATLVKDSAAANENKEGGKKKGGKNIDNLQREITALQAKVRESETKLKEVLKQKEGLESAMKNTKKESLLMRAKMKEFESLKLKCKELDACKEKLKGYEAFNLKLKDLETKIEKQEMDITTLNSSLNETSCQNIVLKEREDELCLQVDKLNKEKEDLQQKISNLEELYQKSHENILQYQVQLKHAEAEKEEWMVKFESLRDCIPERDTSTQPAVQLGVLGKGSNVDQTFGKGQERLGMSSAVDHDSTQSMVSGRPMNNLGYLCETPHTTVMNGAQFDKTMADLQAQVNLTSKALQDKEKQIQTLQHRLSIYKEEEARASSLSSSSVNSQVAGDHVLEESVPESVHKKKIHDLLQKIEQLRLSGGSDVCDGKAGKSGSAEDKSSEIQSILAKVKSLECAVESKNGELEEVQTKMSLMTKEFQEKQRRYESNVRLLTRKLKEHMKGRKSAEKEMQTQAEDHQRILNEEQQRYSVLRCRYIELEGRGESLEGQVASLESEVEEVRGALERSRQEAYDHHNNTLQLQKEIGRLQELDRTSDNLRQEVLSLKEIIAQRDQQLKKMEHELRLHQEELEEVKSSSVTLSEKITSKEKELDDVRLMKEQLETEIQSLSQTLKTKEHALSNAETRVAELESKNVELQNSVIEMVSREQQISSEIQKAKEEKCLLSNELENTRTQLKDSLAKIAAFESQIMVVEGQLKASSEELNQLKEQLDAKVASHQLTVEQLEQSVARARQEVAALTTQLSQVQRERVSYQTQAVELRTALHTALGQLSIQKAEREAQEAEESTISSEAGVIPSPSPLDLTSLTQLMERSARPPQSTLPLTSLETCLSSLKQEVAILQTQLHNKQEALARETMLDTADDPFEEGKEPVPVQNPVDDTNQSKVHDV